MGAFILVVIIIAFQLVRLSVKSKKGASKPHKSRAQQEADMQSMVQARRDARLRQENHTERSVRQAQKHYETATPNRPEPGTVTAALNRPESGQTIAKPNVPRKEHPGLRQRFAEYKQAKKSSAKSAATVFEDMKKEDILTAAKENTVEVAQDNDRDEQVWAVNLDQVYDLMVKGPADTMTFQRDFVAEGMDMLNRLAELPDSGALSEYL